MLAYSNGLLRYFGPDMLLIAMAWLFLTVIGMTHSIYVSMLFRVASLFYDSRFGELTQELREIIRVFLGSLALAALVFEGK